MTTVLEPTTDPGLSPDEMTAARVYADWLGEMPRQNELMRTLKIGKPKARALLAYLAEPDPGPSEQSERPSYDMPTAEWTYVVQTEPQATVVELKFSPVPDPPAPAQTRTPRPPHVWPLFGISLPAFVAVWSGWVGLGSLTGFGIIHPLPGIADNVSINTAITLPIGVEVYAAYAIYIWLSTRVSTRARRFARTSAIAALMLGAGGQIAYHLMSSHHITAAPWWVTTVVASLPVAVVGAGSALAHLVHSEPTQSA